MRARENQLTSNMQEKRLLDATEICLYLNMGRSKGIEFAKEIGAERRIGRRQLFDRKVIDRHFDEMMQEA